MSVSEEDIDIEVFVKNGEAFQVNYKGEQVRAIVHDYDVAFPCVANNLSKDTDGDFFTSTVI